MYVNVISILAYLTVLSEILNIPVGTPLWGIKFRIIVALVHLAQKQSVERYGTTLHYILLILTAV